ncbi:MAG: zinc-ribbon domain-containing protein [Desulfarculaceae bacterium]|nr:zinc-ribbon domain-containing protein [Desulfarculaceae bacterium]
MIIACDKCSTKFNLDETRIKPTGSKVRCSVCSNLFTAFPPETPEPDERKAAGEKPGDMEAHPAPDTKEPDEDLDEPEKAVEDDSFPGLEGIDDIDHEFGIEDGGEEDPAEPETDLTADTEPAQESEKEKPASIVPAYELEIDKELEEEISSLEKEDQDTEGSAAEPEVPDEPFQTEPGFDSDLVAPSRQEKAETDTELDFEEDSLKEDLRDEAPDLDLESDEEFSLDEENESLDLDLDGIDFDESPDSDTLEAVPDEPGREPESFDSGEESFEKDLGEESSEIDIKSEEEFSLDAEDDALDLDLEEFETPEDQKEPEFDLDLDDETLELGMEDLEADEETDFDTGEEEKSEFDFMTADDESFELEIDSDLDEEVEEEGSGPQEETGFEEKKKESAGPEKQPELEIGDLDLAETDEMDIELDDETGAEQSDEFEFELEEEDEGLGAGFEFEEEDESEPPASTGEAAEEFDLTLYDESLEEEFEEEEDTAEDTAEKTAKAPRAQIEEEKIEKPSVPDFMDQGAAEKSSGSSKFLKFLLSVLVVAIMLVAGYSTCIIMGIEVPYISSLKIPFVESVLQKYQSRPEAANITLDNQSINGRFASNESEGKLFIITGRAANKSAFPVSHLQVEGTLITKGDVTARTKQVYCGNMIPEETLKTAEISSIDKLLSKKGGENGSNKNIRPNGSIPFMIVFSKLPDNLENFSVKPAGHSRPGQKN